MIFIKYIIHALGSLWRNKLRSALSILGIIIGISSVTFMVWIWEWMRKSMLQDMSSAADVITVNQNGNAYRWEDYDMYEDSEEEEYYEEEMNLWDFVGMGIVWVDSIQTPSIDANSIRPKEVFTLEVMKQIEELIPNVRAALALENINTNNMSLDGKDIWGQVQWTPLNYVAGKWLSMLYGFSFTKEHFDTNARVTIIGKEMVRYHFNGQNPIGKTVLIDGTPFEIIGVYDVVGNRWNSLNTSLLIPITTAHTLYGEGKFSSFEVYMSDVLAYDQVQKDLLYFLYRYSGVASPDQATFEIQSNEEAIESIEKMIGNMTMFLWGIAGISLFVGGIGIMNVMLMWVIERTREIGIRKAIGAKKLDILFQFLVEAIVMSVVGCALALWLTMTLVQFVQYVPMLMDITGNNGVVINMKVFQLASMISVGMGVVFGILPAWKAARMKPIDALRFE